jgi:hypothetical protein
MIRYIFVLDEGAFAVFLKARGRARLELVRAFESLANNPYCKGENTAKHECGRPLELKRFGGWIVTFWSDHANREVRIVEITKLQI